MIKIVAENFVRKEMTEKFLETAGKLVTESRKEAGNISYALHQDIHDEAHFTFIEEWKDQEAIDYHNSSEHYTTYVPQMRECCEKSGSCTLYRPID